MKRRIPALLASLLLSAFVSPSAAQYVTGVVPRPKPIHAMPQRVPKALGTPTPHGGLPKPSYGRVPVLPPKIINVTPHGRAPSSGAIATSAGTQAAGADRAAGKSTAPSDPPLWRVRSKTATVYILGSVHVADDSIFPLGRNVEDAFHLSTTVAFETELTPTARESMRRLLETYGTYPPGESIDRHLDAGLIRKLDGLLARHDLNRQAFHRLRPWYLDLVLSSIAYRNAGYSREYGVEEHLRAQAMRKTIDHIETFAQQAEVFRLMPEATQVAVLRDTLEHYDAMGSQLAELLRAWKAGDLGVVQRVILDPMRRSAPEFYANILTERNRTMSQAVERYLGGAETTLVVVGCAHLVGDESVLQMLAARGYVAERL